MIVVIGSPILRLSGGPSSGGGGSAPAGPAAAVALAAAAAGASVQLVGKVGDDDAGDAILVALGPAGVSHAATLRDPANATPTWTALTEEEASSEGPLSGGDAEEQPTAAFPAGLPLEAADVELALRYLTDFRVVVLAADLDDATIRVALEAAAYAGAHVIRFDGLAAESSGGSAGTTAGRAEPEVTVVAASSGAVGPFATLIGRYAAGLDGGQPPERAFRDAVRASGWEPAAD